MADPLAKATGTANGEVDPKEAARIQKSIRGLEQAPSSRQQLGSFANWQAVRDQLGQPFNNERIPLSKLRLMRRDAMFSFGLHYQKLPIVRAPWYMKSSDPQIAGFFDAALRPIYPGLVTALLQKLDFGFQAIAERYALSTPDATYVDPADGQEKPVWSGGTGGIQPVIWKPGIPLAPDTVEPIFDDKSGEFGGIKFTPPAGAPAGVGAKAKGSGGSSGAVEIDLYHSLWASNEKESVFGNIFGYPRLGYGYPYWWSYWFRWAIADRAFEKKGDPSIVVRHPEGTIEITPGEEVSNAEYALEMADRLRSGAGIALPSTPYTGFDDRPSAVPEWNIEFLKGGVELDPFDKSFDYLDIMKLRSVLVPEQALIEGGGGTSSRNVADEMFQALVESTSVLMDEVVETVNRYMIPLLMQVNFPDKVTAGVGCKMVARGFSATDLEFMQQIIQLIGQAKPDELGMDVREALRQMNMPLLPESVYQQRLQQAATAAAASGPGTVTPGPDQSGVVPTPGRAPATNGNTPGPDNVGAGGSATGFTYVPAMERIEFSDASAQFLADLPPTIHYSDQAVRALTRQLWRYIHDFYSEQYAEFAAYVEANDAIFLSDEDEEAEGIELAVPEVIADMARRVVSRWKPDQDKLSEAINRIQALMDAIINRSGKIAASDTSLDTDSVSTWLQDHVGEVIAKAIKTTRSELEGFVGSWLTEQDVNNRDREALAKQLREHFTDFPTWKANRFARSEVRDAFNAGVLLSGMARGKTTAQAMDALKGPTDPECEHRDGQIFPIDDALREREHPNGTLAWRVLDDRVTLSKVAEVPGPEGAIGSFDPEHGVIYLQRGIDPLDERLYLRAVGDKLS